MKLEYENGVLRVENAEGLRWQLTEVQKPQLAFDYDALHVSAERALRRVGPSIHPLADAQVAEVQNLIQQMVPPPWATFQAQITMDLRALGLGLINSVMTELEYDGLLDVMVTGRAGSTDLYAEEARRVLSYIDSLWNAFYGLAAQIKNTPTSELMTVKEYADMMPFPPSVEYFSGDLLSELFNAARSNR